MVWEKDGSHGCLARPELIDMSHWYHDFTHFRKIRKYWGFKSCFCVFVLEEIEENVVPDLVKTSLQEYAQHNCPKGYTWDEMEVKIRPYIAIARKRRTIKDAKEGRVRTAPIYT
jgi:hypothetical protein